MFLSSLKNKFRIKRIENAFKTLERERLFPLIDNLKSIGILYSDFDDTQVEAMKTIVLYMKKRNVEVDCLAISNLKREGSEDRNVVFISDLTFLGLPKLTDISFFCEKKFDILLNLTNTLDHRVEFVVVNSKAKCRISSQHSNSAIFDLVIDVGMKKPIFLFDMVVESLSKFNN